MKNVTDKSLRNLNDCGCCEGINRQTPQKVYNRPGLSAVAYRVGVHSEFKQTLLARISGSRQPSLRNLTTRDNEDFTIALLDAWATVSDMLTFYQERLVNEFYLRTATERLSVLELARLIGYELNPGVAASTYFAFTIENVPGAFGEALVTGKNAETLQNPPPIIIDTGTKVQSVPGPDEQAQLFETIEKIEARAEWNAIKPRLTQPQELSVDMGSVILQGTATNLNKGDTVLIIEDSGNRKARTIQKVTPDDEAKTTRIDFEKPQLSPSSYERPSSLSEGKISDFPEKTELDENVLQDIISKTWSEEDLSSLIKIQDWPVDELVTNIVKQTARRTLVADTGVFAFRQRAAIFGHNAPNYISLLKPNGSHLYPYDWDTNGWEIWKDSMTNTYYSDADVYLERSLQGVIKDSWALFEKPAAAGPSYTVYKVSAVIDASLVGFGISAKSTGLNLAKPDGINLANTDKSQDFKVRKTIMHLQSEKLPLAEVPIVDNVPIVNLAEGDSITLGRIYLGLKKEKKVILSGERSDLKGVIGSEVKILKDVIIEAGFTVITFDKELANSYVRNSVNINANVAQGTHGETVEEILGSGDAGQSFQRFILRQPPLTYVGAPTPSGSQTTLEIRVNEILWQEVPTFFGRGPEDRIFITRMDDDGKTTVIFGDGKTGARLPTGQENVNAKYRKGIGVQGLVKADKLSQLMTRPLGVKGVTNPLASNTAADQEGLANARINAPLTVLTLDRIVSLKDYEDFARAFAGIDKALAIWSWNGMRRTVFVTVSGTDGAEVKEVSELHDDLLEAIYKFGNPNVPVIIKSYQSIFFRVQAKIEVLPEYLTEKVLEAVKQTLRDKFSFERREFGQPVYLSEIVEVIHKVLGVRAVDIDKLYRIDQPDVNRKLSLEAAMPQIEDDNFFAAELLTLDPGPIELGVMS